MTWENRWYVDLALVGVLTGLALLAIVAGSGGWLRSLLTALLVTLLPGYALIALLYPEAGKEASRTFDENERGLNNPLPGKRGVDPIERFAFSVAASLILVPLVALVANFTPWGITRTPILFGTAGLTLLFVFGALARRARLLPEHRHVPAPSQVVSNVGYSTPKTGFRTGNDWTRRFNIALVASLLLLAASVGVAAMNPPQSDGFTEFYVETGNVTADTQSMYPSQFTTGESRELTVAVTNHEHERTSYSMIVLLQRVDGSGDNATVQEERQLTQESFALEPEATENVSLSITPRTAGTDLRLGLLLYRGEPPADPSMENAYRVLRLPIDVAESPGSGAQSESEFDASAQASPPPTSGR